MTERDPQQEPEAESDDSAVGRAFWRSLAVVAVLGVVAFGAYLFNRPTPKTEVPKEPEKPEARAREKAAIEPPTVVFTDVTKAAGIDFEHCNGATAEKLLPETMGGGGGFFDFDNDGDQDLFCVNSCTWPWTVAVPNPKPTLRLYANDGKGRFADVTKAAGLDVTMYGMGVAFGDFDNDGWTDVFVTGLAYDPKSSVGPNRLFRNERGKFTDVTATAGVAGRPGSWSTAAAWFDYDNDGRLDLVALEYVKWSRAFDLSQPFTLVGGGRGYGRPQNFPGAFPYLFRNDGGGKFADVAEKAGLYVKDFGGDAKSKALGIAPVDLDGDGWMDFVVANDMVQNFVFHNQRNGTFAEIGVDSQIAFNAAGVAQGAMGIDSAYFRNDSSLAVGIGNFANEMTSLYVSQPQNRLLFKDSAISTGVGPPSRAFLKFGLFFLDVDLDGRLDLFEANGHLETDIAKVQASQTYAQPPQLFWNAGPGQRDEFVDMPLAKVGADFKKPIVGRGAAYADIDGDGDLDLAIFACGAAPRLLRNETRNDNNWLRFSLKGNGKTSNGDAVGAWIEVETSAGLLRRQVMPTRGYLSQVERPVTVGIGRDREPKAVRVIWPDGAVQPIAKPEVGGVQLIEQPAKNSSANRPVG